MANLDDILIQEVEVKLLMGFMDRRMEEEEEQEEQKEEEGAEHRRRRRRPWTAAARAMISQGTHWNGTCQRRMTLFTSRDGWDSSVGLL